MTNTSKLSYILKLLGHTHSLIHVYKCLSIYWYHTSIKYILKLKLSTSIFQEKSENISQWYSRWLQLQMSAVDMLCSTIWYLNVKYYDHYLILMSCFYKKTLERLWKWPKKNEHNKNYLMSKYLSRNVCCNLRYIIEIQFVG